MFHFLSDSWIIFIILSWPLTWSSAVNKNICTDDTGDLYLGAGTSDHWSKCSEEGVLSEGFKQSHPHPVRSGPDHVFSNFPGGESQRWDSKTITATSNWLETSAGDQWWPTLTFTDIQFTHIDIYWYPIYQYWVLPINRFNILDMFKFLISDTNIHRYQQYFMCSCGIFPICQICIVMFCTMLSVSRSITSDFLIGEGWKFKCGITCSVLCVPECVCKEVESVCAQCVVPYISSILEALAERINTAFSDMQHTLRTQMDAVFTLESGGAEQTQKVTSQSVSSLPWRPSWT